MPKVYTHLINVQLSLKSLYNFESLNFVFSVQNLNRKKKSNQILHFGVEDRVVQPLYVELYRALPKDGLEVGRKRWLKII